MRVTLSEIAAVLGLRHADILWGTVLLQRDDDQYRPPFAFADNGNGPMVTVDDRALLDMAWSGEFPKGGQIDSRQVQAGDLFFCIKGEHADGHDFAGAAARAGACAIIAQWDPFAGERSGEGGPDSLPPVFLVPDVIRALQRLALCHRDTCMAKVVGITGSAGKTSVKEVLAHVLAVRGQTERNPLNKNNGIGLPLSMINASAYASYWVMEVGISQPHDMDELGEILRPDLVIVLNVGDAHSEGLGDRGVAHYKAKLLEYVQPNGTGFYSADYPDLEKAVNDLMSHLKEDHLEVLRFSANSQEGVYCRAAYEGATERGSGRFRVFIDKFERQLEAPFRGEMGSENVAAIFAAATKLGLTFEEILRGLSTAVLPDHRFSSSRKGGFVIVDDSYNANPLSSRRMLDAVEEMAGEAGIPLILVMGEMGELGQGAEMAHIMLGQHIASVRPAAVFWKGNWGGAVLRGLKRNGYAGVFHEISGPDDLRVSMAASALREGLVLFKGSRMNRLEELVQSFSEQCVEQKDL